MKFQIGLAVLMICAILCGILYLVLDDRFFCLKNPRAELCDATNKNVHHHHIITNSVEPNAPAQTSASIARQATAQGVDMSQNQASNQANNLTHANMLNPQTEEEELLCKKKDQQ